MTTSTSPARSSSGLTAAVPARHDAVELERGPLDIGHHDHRPAGFEQHAFRDQFFHGALVGLGLADDGEVEAARDLSELLAGPGKAGGQHGRLGRYAGAFRRRRKPGHGGLRRRLTVALLGLYHLRRDVTGGGDRDDRVVGECDAGDVRVKRRGDRDGVVAGIAAAFGNAQINDDILDGHGGISLLPAVLCRPCAKFYSCAN